MSDGVELKHITPMDNDVKPEAGFSNPGFSNGNNNVMKDNNEKPPNYSAHSNSHTPVYDSTVVSVDDIDPKLDFVKFDEIPPPDGVALKIHTVVEVVGHSVEDHTRAIKWIIIGALLIVYAIYFGFAMAYEFGSEESVRLLWVTCVVVFGITVSLLWSYFGDSIKEVLAPCLTCCDLHGRKVLWAVLILIYIGVIVFILVDVFVISKEPYNLVSLGGLLCYILLCFVFSYSPAHVNWRAVLWGIALQFIMALIILRWTWGYNAFLWLGNRVSEFLAHADAGSEFIFGSAFKMHFFAFAVLPVVIFFSTAISILYYLGAMQVVIQKVGWVLQSLMGTTAGESLNAAGNIFIGQSEAPLMIRPLLPDMTRSEIHAVMTGGFATIAGSVLAAYILFGVPANHLISASVMSAPAALAMAKLFYPETQVSKTTADDVKHMEASKERNIIEAASAGASTSIKLVANIAANLIAFIALLHFINSTLSWFGNRVGWYGEDALSFEMICSYVFFPLALVMGTNLQDCRIMGELIGVKTFLNEFVAYDRLGVIIQNKVKLTAHLAVNGTYAAMGSDIMLYNFTDVKNNFHNETLLPRGILTDRTEVIATYALCGFANFGSMGIMLGALGAMAPHRKSDLARVVVRAMIAGNVACFMTACVAGIFYQPSSPIPYTPTRIDQLFGVNNVM